MSLKSWKNNLVGMLTDPYDYPGDSDHPKCPKCGATMDFYGHDENGDFAIGDGYWKCPDCDWSISESEIYG